jgi:type IV fimbrial biogenesis protein FimT
MPRHAGFTLADLITTLAVLSIIAAAALPALQELLLDAHMTRQVNGLVHSIHLAKQTAHVRIVDTVLCKSSSGLSCDHEADWQGGWLLFANVNADHPPQADPGEPRLAAGGAWSGGRISANRAYFVFRPADIRSTNGTLVFCDRRGSEKARALVVSYTGRPRTARHGPRNAALIC